MRASCFGLLWLALALPTEGLAQEDYRARAFQAEERGNFKEAAELFSKLIKAGAGDQKVFASATNCLEKAGRYTDCLDLLHEARRRFADEPSFGVGLARVYNLKASQIWRSSGKFDQFVIFGFDDAIDAAEEVLKTHPGNRDARLILASSFYSLGKWKEANVQAEEIVRRFPNHPGGHIVMGDLAFEHYKALRQKASEEGADTSKPTMLKIAGAREAAKKSYKRAIELDAKRVMAHLHLGDVYAWNMEVKPALEKYRDVLVLDPQAPVSHGWISQNLRPEELARFYVEAGQDYTQQKGAENKKAALFSWYAAFAYTRLEEHKKAEQFYLLAVRMNPAYVASYYYAMWSAYEYRRNYDDALDYASKYAAREPIKFADFVRMIQPAESRKSVEDCLKYLARMAANKGRRDASRNLNHVLAATLDTGEAWNNYAFMARETGRYQESLKAYQHALEVEPGSGQLMNDMAVILHFHLPSVENLKRAEALYKKAVVAAQRVLRSPKSDAQAKRVARTTKRDATTNLRKLKADRRRQ